MVTSACGVSGLAVSMPRRVHAAGAVQVVFGAELVEQVGEGDFGPRGFAGVDDLAPGCFRAGDVAVSIQQAGQP